MKLVISALALALTAAANAAAPTQAPAPANPANPIARAAFLAKVDGNFQRNDANHDNFLSKEEIAATELRAQQQISARMTERRKDAFDRLDANHDGNLSLAEFGTALPDPQPDDGSKAVGVLDTNKDGKVSLDEFRAPAVKRFAAIDTNGDGTVSPDEMRGQE